MIVFTISNKTFFYLLKAELADIDQVIAMNQDNKRSVRDKIEAMQADLSKLDKKKAILVSGKREIKVCFAWFVIKIIF